MLKPVAFVVDFGHQTTTMCVPCYEAYCEDSRIALRDGDPLEADQIEPGERCEECYRPLLPAPDRATA